MRAAPTALFVALALSSGHALAEATLVYERVYDDWSHEAWLLDDGSITCDVSTYLADDGRVAVEWWQKYDDVSLVIRRTGWRLDLGKAYDVDVEIGRLYTGRGVADAISDTTMTLTLDDVEFMDALYRGREMSIRVGGATPILLSLTGSARAINDMVDCFDEVSKAYATGAEQPRPRQYDNR